MSTGVMKSVVLAIDEKYYGMKLKLQSPLWYSKFGSDWLDG